MSYEMIKPFTDSSDFFVQPYHYPYIYYILLTLWQFLTMSTPCATLFGNVGAFSPHFVTSRWLNKSTICPVRALFDSL